MKNKLKKKRPPVMEGGDNVKRKKNWSVKQKYNHKGHWLMEDDDYYDLPKNVDEEE